MLKAAAVFQSGMILQREKPVPVWGTAAPGEAVTVEIQGRCGQGLADENGKWYIELPALTASRSEQMRIGTEQEQIKLEDVAVGEVWLAGGQSNMEFCMRYEKHKVQAVKDCENPDLRFYDVPEVCYEGQQEEFDYSCMEVWRKADPKNLDYFSAVGYYFQKEIWQQLNVPVGIIGCNWGGTTASAWMDPETVKKAGEPWIAEYERKISERNMEEYWAKQHGNPKNNRGNLFDAFAEIVLPRTLSEEELQELAATMEPPEEDPKNALFPQQVPGCLYEYMLKTVVPFGIRGILWYQGESDDVPGLNLLYKDMLTGLIADWRKLWKEKLPFLFVQLPGFDTWLWNSPVNEFSIIRRCQEEVADTVEGAYMCSISDAGEERDIHPKDKKTVGERLSLLARHYVYGEDILCDAPRAEQIVREGSRITITFANAGEGLYISGDRLTALSVTAGEKELSWTAAVQGNQLIIELSKEDAEEKEVRTAFARTGWYLVNLYNSAGIPAVPFEFQVVK